MIEEYLRDLESRIDPQVEENLLRQWRAFADGQCEEEIFAPQRPKPAPPGVAWPHVLVNDALEDREAMALQQLEQCSNALAGGSGALLAVRCNYGTAILPSLFGGEIYLMERDIDTLPACRPLAGGAEAVRGLLDRGAPDLEAGLGAKTFRMGRYFGQLFRDYPRLAQHVFLYHPDLQGPMNVCEMLWGSSLYVDLYDKPDLVRDFLSLITETYIRFMRRWEEIAVEKNIVERLPLLKGSSSGCEARIGCVTRETSPTPAEGRQTKRATPPLDTLRSLPDESRRRPTSDDGYAVHWSMLQRGRIMVRDDAATNLSPAMYEDFVGPFDQRLLHELGGGGIHFCGRGDHLMTKISQLSGLYALNTTQPALNNIETIFTHTIDKQISLLGFDRAVAAQALRQGRRLRGRVHCW